MAARGVTKRVTALAALDKKVAAARVKVAKATLALEQAETVLLDLLEQVAWVGVEPAPARPPLRDIFEGAELFAVAPAVVADTTTYDI